MATTRWTGAADLIPAPAGHRPRPEIVALPPEELPSLDRLFTFMRDAELRVDTLRMRIEERSFTATGERIVVSDLLLRHPGEARVTTSTPGHGARGSYEVWISDGDIVRTYSSTHRSGTERPVRRMLVGVGPEARELPRSSRVYRPRTALAMETLPETFLHPGGYCQNVLSTGACRVLGLDDELGREVVIVECAHPRTIEMAADRPDFRIRIAVDRADGVILHLEESIGGIVTRDARVTEYAPNAALPPNAFDFVFPTGTTMLY
jgi:outer membrane lipoprotein-sorting protein